MIKYEPLLTGRATLSTLIFSRLRPNEEECVIPKRSLLFVLILLYTNIVRIV